MYLHYYLTEQEGLYEHVKSKHFVILEATNTFVLIIYNHEDLSYITFHLRSVFLSVS